MKGELRRARCFLEDVEHGDVILVGKSFYRITNTKREGETVTLFSDHLRLGGSPVKEGKWFTPITVYVRK